MLLLRTPLHTCAHEWEVVRRDEYPVDDARCRRCGLRAVLARN